MKMEYERILAKSPKKGKPAGDRETLMGHTEHVVESFKILFGSEPGTRSRLAKAWFRFFKIPEKDFESFYINGLLSCGLHDIGKANSGFQDMLRKKGVQVIRHEHLSGLIISLPTVREWFKRFDQSDPMIVFSAVAGHHLKSSKENFAEMNNPDLKIFRVFPETILDIFDYTAKSIGFPPDRNIEIDEVWDFEGAFDFKPNELASGIKKKKIRRLVLDLRKNESRKRMLMAVRAALILSDSSGSAIAREEKKIDEWLETAFSDELDANYILENVIDPRIEEIKQKNGEFNWNDFQKSAETLPERALLLAPCGSGKTLAAWRWIKSRLEENPAGKVIFLYPTRATATEGFRDYVSWAPESDAALAHGTAAYELEDMFDNPEDEKHGKDFTTEDRMYALGFWHRRVFSATVDQFLGFMQQVYRSVCLMPIVADSVVVFDEAHSFDRSLFSALKLFLKNFDVPVLCMTATLPPVRRGDLIEECGLTPFPGDSQACPDLDSFAEMPRYHVESIADPEEAGEIMLSNLDEGKRVLWVVNTVSRCQELAMRFSDLEMDFSDLSVLCYHSRLKLDDRKKRHTKIIKAFQTEKFPVVAFTTQVCEMSLDLDADILISETAPITAMIQRMGRCNRHAKPEDKRLGRVCFYAPENEKPYNEEDLAGIAEFLAELKGNTVSQSAVSALLDKYGPSDEEIEQYSAFLKNGPWADSREQSLRDETDYTVNAILSDDVSDYFKLRNDKEPIDGLIVPVPKKFAKPHRNIGRFPLVAPSNCYDSKYGFLDQ